ncbi:MAG: two-component regulator propeller domain-containing protein [Caldilinea sp.]
MTAFATDKLKGRLWAGSKSGLLAQWEDDAGWVLLRSLETAIHALASSDDSLWIGTDSGLLRLHDGSIQPVPELGSAPVHTLAVIDGFVWVGNQDALWRLSSDLATHEVHRPTDEKGIALNGPFTAIWAESADNVWFATATTISEYFAESGETLVYPSPFGATIAGITAIEGVEQNSVWVASSGGGAAQFRLAGREIASMRSWGGSAQGGLTANNVRDIAIDQDGSVWFATSVGVFRYQIWAFQEVDERMDSLPVYDVLFDRRGNLWVATDGEGILVRTDRHRQPTQYLPDGAGLPGSIVYALQQDDLGRVWAATNGGIAYFESQRWHQPLTLRNLALSPASDLKADSLGIWIGTANGVHRYLYADQSMYIEAPTKGEPIGALEFDSIGRLWAAGAGGDLWIRNVDGNWQAIEMTSEEMPEGAPATAFYPESEPPGSMLVAFKGYGIYRYWNATWESIDKSRKIGDERVYTLLSDPDTNSIWVGGEIGLSRLDPHGIVRFDSQDGLQPGAVRTIMHDSSGVYWFGGDRGLSYYEPEQSSPWVQLNAIKGAELANDGDDWQVLTDTPVEFIFSYGDLQTHPTKLQLFTRLSNGAETENWQSLPTKSYQSTFSTPGRYTLEYMIRDQALNYSPVQSVELAVALAPTYTSVPLLGRVENRVFQLLVLFGSLAVFGFGFVSIEILQHRRRVGEAIARGYNPYISGEPVRREDMFFGRHELLQRIVSTLHNNSIMIHGERRIGKTTLLYQLVNTLRQIDDRDYWFVALYVDLEGTTEETFFHLLMEEIAHHAYALDDLDAVYLAALDSLIYHAAPAAAYSDREFSRDLRQVIEVLEAYGVERHPNQRLRLILLMDEMDTLSHFNHLIQQQLRRIFMREFAASLGAVVAGIEISKEWERIESPWFNLFNEIAMQPFTRQEAIHLLVEPVRGYYIYEPDALDFILEQSEGRPYRLQQYGMEAVNEMLRRKRRRITKRDALSAHEIIQSNSQLGVGLSGAPVLETFSMATTSLDAV